MRNFSLVVFFTYAGLHGFSQENVASLNIDSMKAVLVTAKDTSRINALNLLSRRMMFQVGSLPNKTTRQYTDEAMELSRKINYRKGIGNAFLNKGIEASLNEHYNKSLPLLRKAMPLLKESKDIYGIAAAYDFLGYTSRGIGNNTTALFFSDSAVQLYLSLNDSSSAVWSMVNVMRSYHDLGNYEEAYKEGQRALNELPKSDTILHAFVLVNLANLFLAAGLPEIAIDFVHKIRVLYSRLPSRTTLSWPLPTALRIGADAFLQMNKLDSALAMEKIFQIPLKNQDANDNLFYGRLNVAQKQYEKALPYFTNGLNTASGNQYKIVQAQNANELGNTYLLLNDHKKAIHYALHALQIGKSIQALHEIKTAAATLTNIYEKEKIYSKAYYYDKLYKSTSNLLATEEYKRKLSLVQIQNELDKQVHDASLLLKENLIAKQKMKIKEKEIEKVSILKNILIASLGVFLLFGIIIFRNITLKRRNDKQRLEHKMELQKIEDEKRKAEFQQQTIELEMQVLRAQMNPHFIFNSLNSINRFILQNNRTQASEDLTKFSRLVRFILQNSKASLIPLVSELEALQLYLELESVRFDHHFHFTIHTDEGLDMSGLKVPPLIIQPYVENAIWHGLMHKEERGNLQIELFEAENMLCCKISDDGVGRKKAAQLKSKSASTHTSMGMQITADRIAMLHKVKELTTQIKITDLILPDGNAGGTEVLLKIPLCYD